MGEPIVGTTCSLDANGKKAELTSDGDGVVEMEIPCAARKASLTTEDQAYELCIGDLDPIDTPSGLHARLRNLGYDLGSQEDEDAVDPDRLGFAIELFQLDHGLPVTGAADEETESAIQQAAGA
jgi:hypothetical protein